jgi:O-antigen/teichoic acid export membrane protein
MKLVKVSTDNIGMYNAAYTVGSLIQNVGYAAGLAIGPLMNTAYKENNDKKARNLVFILQVVFFAITFSVSVWLKEIFQLLIKNAALQKVYPIGIVIVMAYNYRPMYFGANNKLFYAERTRLLVRITFIAGMINVLFNLIFIPIYGYQVAAYTTFVALMYMGYAGYYFKVFKEINKVEYYPFIWILLTVLLSLIAYFMVEAGVLIKIFSCLACSVTAAFFVYKFNRQIK